MTCKKCNAYNEDSAKFCQNCGEKLDEISLTNDLPSETTSNTTNVGEEKIKRSNPIFKTIIIAIVVLLFVEAAIALIFLPNIERAVMGDSKYYLYKECKTISSMFDFEDFSDLRHPDTYSAKSTAKFEYVCDGEKENIPITADADVNYSKDNGNVSVDVNILNNSKKIIQTSTYFKDKKTTFTNNLMNTSFKLDLNKAGNLSKSETKSDDTSSQEIPNIIIPTDSQKKAAVEILNNVCKENLDKNFTNLGKQELNGKKYQVVEFNLTPVELTQIIKSVVNKVNMNPDLVKYVNHYIPYLVDEDDATINSLNDISFTNSDFQNLKYKIYYDKRGNVSFRQMNLDGKDIFSLSNEKSKNSQSVDVTIGLYSLKYTKSENNGENNISFYIQGSESSKETYSVNINNMKVEKINNVSTLVGNVSCVFDEGYGEKSTVSINANNSNGKYIIEFGFKEDAEKITAEIVTDLSTSATVKEMDDKQNCNENYSEYFKEFYNRAYSAIESMEI